MVPEFLHRWALQNFRSAADLFGAQVFQRLSLPDGLMYSVMAAEASPDSAESVPAVATRSCFDPSSDPLPLGASGRLYV